jgi:adenosylcobinamide kinase / adenosylcobinamide-phosphate guanylyltransferase
MTKGSPGAVLVLGGARSGKSRFAEGLARQSGLDRHYLATGQAYDDEMRDRIARHKHERAGDGWTTHEEPVDLIGCLRSVDDPGRVILVDCLTLWVSNLMMAEADIDAASRALADYLPQAKGRIILVSNEVGLGIVPENAMARAFRDHAGRLHQMAAEKAAEVYFIAAGLPLKMKG